MQFTKLFNSILDSTIWQEPLETKVVWITMLAMSDRNGELFASVPGLAKRAGVTLAQCEAAIACLSSPDAYSRTKAHEGRRIKEIDGGWALLNHAKYRALLSAEERKEYNRRKQAEYRSSQKTVSNVNECQKMSMTVNDSEQCQHIQKQRTEAEADAESEANQNSISKNNDDDGKKVHFSMPSLEEFTAYYGKAMEDVDLGEHLMLSDWLLEQHSYCSEKWAEQPVNNWKSQTGRFTRLYRTHWERTKPDFKTSSPSDCHDEDIAF